jgi:hypothetical protein
MKKNRNRNICKNNDGQVALYDHRRGNFILSLDLYDGYLVFILPIFNKRQMDITSCAANYFWMVKLILLNTKS